MIYSDLLQKAGPARTEIATENGESPVPGAGL